MKKYKAHCSKVTPTIHQKNFYEKSRKCIIGISLKNPVFTVEKIRALVNFANSRFEQCVILVGDSIYRHTIHFSDIQLQSNDEAFEKALSIGKEKIEEIEQIISDKTKDEVYIETCHNIQQLDLHYKKFHESVLEEFGKKQFFYETINNFSIQYVNKRMLEFSEKMADLYTTYILEEIAIMACLSREGFNTLMYPGSLNFFNVISNGEIPTMCTELKNLICCEMSFKKRGGAAPTDLIIASNDTNSQSILNTPT